MTHPNDAEAGDAIAPFPSSRPFRPAHQPLGQLSHITPERVTWLSRGRLAAGKITVLEGDPGLGKSTLLAELAARVTRGEPLPGGGPGSPRNVLLMSAEDDLNDTVRPRIDAAGGDPERVFTMDTMPLPGAAVRPVFIPRELSLITLVVARLAAALLIVDPLVAFLDRRLSVSRDQDVRQALFALKTVAEQTGAAVVVVRHLNKSVRANPLYRGSGSLGIITAARCGLLLTRDPDDSERRILAATKGNYGQPPPSLAFRLQPVPGADVTRVVWEGPSRWTAADLHLLSLPETETTTLGVARAWLRAALQGGPRPVKELQREAEAHGIALSTLYAARKAEGVRKQKARVRGGHWFWAPPDQEAPR